MFGINCRSRLAPALPLSLRCFDEVDSVCFDSHLVDFAVLDSCQFGFVFDDFVFEFAEWTIFRVGIGRNFVFFGSLLKCEFGSVGQAFYPICGDFKRNLFAHYFLLVP